MDSISTAPITKFDGDYFFLSNFYTADFPWRGELYPSGEHAFQSAKRFHMLNDQPHEVADYDINVRNAPTPAKAKYLGRSVKIDLDSWGQQKVWYMREIVHAKFEHVPGLAGQLINTGASMLVEGNTWGDKFWGRCHEDGKWVGLNLLGVILMEERGRWLGCQHKS